MSVKTVPCQSGRVYNLLTRNSLLLCFVDITASFSEIEVCFCFCVNSFNLQQCCVLMLVSQTSLETSEDSFDIKPKQQ